jgi:hypothetical protein
VSRAAYKPLLDAGVRVFEWDGTMLHAKSAVADGVWARVGSTNLNLASWMGNYELDVAIEDRAFAQRMADQYLTDLDRATEIVLTRRNRVRKTEDEDDLPDVRRARSGSAGRAAAGAVSVGSALSAALTNRRLRGRRRGCWSNGCWPSAWRCGVLAVVRGPPFAFIASRWGSPGSSRGVPQAERLATRRVRQSPAGGGAN